MVIVIDLRTCNFSSPDHHIRSYISNICIVISTCLHGQTFAELERKHWEGMESEWEREKQRILNALVGTGGDALDFPQDTEVRQCNHMAY